jgi:CDP-diacylglycerol pyrophosphatase
MRLHRGTAALLSCLVCACSSGVQPIPAHRDALRRIVQEQCVPHWLAAHSPAPCERLVLRDPPHEHGGYALLADRKGGAHFLLITTASLRGIESPELRDPGAANFFAAAWAARDLIDARIGHAAAHDAIGLAVNPRHARSQDQFHIHIECLRPDIAAELRARSAAFGGEWAPVELGGWHFLAMRAWGETLSADPIALLAQRRPETRRSFGDYSFVVAGMRFSGVPGFVLLAVEGRAGELLLDSTCALAALK